MIEVENITNQIINADCMDILKQLPDKCIDLVLTDPPYGINWGGNYFANKFENKMCWLVWDKGTGENDFADCELAWTSFNTATRKFFKSWVGANAKDTLERMHPTQKPVVLFEWCLQKYSNENDLILDCFSGSGTTAIACHNLKRNFICIEKDKDYWKASVERLKNAQAQMKLDLFAVS